MKKVKKYKISRRLKTPIFEKCQTQKYLLREQRRAIPKQRRRRTSSDYGKQLTEKQKVRYLYGISEQALKNYVKKAVSAREASAEKTLGQALERRLDNVVYQLGLARTRRMARQMVSHGHFTINGRKTTVPSHRVKDSETVSIREGSVRTKAFQLILTDSAARPKANWVKWDAKKRQGNIVGKPEIGESIFSMPAILEYYSR